MTSSCDPQNLRLGNSIEEEVALSGIVDVLAWKHGFEMTLDPNLPRPGQ
jgi:hypothetical protein